MILVELTGGLGNQMFQYALGRMLALARQDTLYLDTRAYDNIPPGDTVRSYALGVFRVRGQLPTPKVTRLLKPSRWLHILANLMGRSLGHTFRIVKENGHAFHKEVLCEQGDLYLSGYWQTEKYFAPIRKILLSDFTPKRAMPPRVRTLAKQMKQGNAVSVHVRRGDYVSNPAARKFHGVLTTAYYQRAFHEIQKHVKNPVFYIFSDDIAWAKKHLAFAEHIVYVSSGMTTADWQDLLLMAACKHHIIANSSFSWWGAWLGEKQGSQIIAPKRWFRQKSVQPLDLIPERWQTI